jgi:hypothetical protein
MMAVNTRNASQDGHGRNSSGTAPGAAKRRDKWPQGRPSFQAREALRRRNVTGGGGGMHRRGLMRTMMILKIERKETVVEGGGISERRKGGKTAGLLSAPLLHRIRIYIFYNTHTL